MPKVVVGDPGLGSRWSQGAVQNPTKLVHIISENRRKANFLTVFGRENGFDIIGAPKGNAYLWEIKPHHCSRGQSSRRERKHETEYRKNFPPRGRGVTRGLCGPLVGERSMEPLLSLPVVQWACPQSSRRTFAHYRTRQRRITPMIFHYHPISENNLIISIDNIVLDVWVSNPDIRDRIETKISCLPRSDVDLVTWEGCRPGTFRQQYLFKLKNGTSFWLGHGLIGTGIAVERYRLEFNPNKVGYHPIFKVIHSLLVRNARKPLSRIARFDLAVDIPVDRAKCFLVKDRRLYIERRHGVEYTQYLGAKSSMVGRVKLYNKTVEAKLAYPLTRLELTLDPAMAYEDVNFPVVYYLDLVAKADERVKVTDTEKFILNAILQGCGTLNDLGRKTRAKMETLLDYYVEQIRVSPEAYSKILAQLAGYLIDDASLVG